jgi:hypothetical protein
MLKRLRAVNGWLDRPRRGTPAGVMLLAYVIRTRLDYVGRVSTGIDNAPQTSLTPLAPLAAAEMPPRRVVTLNIHCGKSIGRTGRKFPM